MRELDQDSSNLHGKNRSCPGYPTTSPEKIFTGKLMSSAERRVRMKELETLVGLGHSAIYAKIKAEEFPYGHHDGRMRYWLYEAEVMPYVRGEWKPDPQDQHKTGNGRWSPRFGIPGILLDSLSRLLRMA